MCNIHILEARGGTAISTTKMNACQMETGNDTMKCTLFELTKILISCSCLAAKDGKGGNKFPPHFPKVHFHILLLHAINLKAFCDSFNKRN